MTVTVKVQLHDGEDVYSMKLDEGVTAGEAWDTATRYDRDFKSGVLVCDENGYGIPDSRRLDVKTYTITVSQYGSSHFAMRRAEILRVMESQKRRLRKDSQA
jgi:stress response protein SCP2